MCRSFFVLLIASFSLGIFALTSSASQTAPATLLCVPEKFWTCDGTGSCVVDARPETLAAWKIDVIHARYALCSRNGAECADWRSLRIDSDSPKLLYTAYDEGSWQPETFKIHRESGKFVAVRLSGGFHSFDSSKSTLKSWPDFTQLYIRQRIGTCIEVPAVGVSKR
jgi:hypothetical protein